MNAFGSDKECILGDHGGGLGFCSGAISRPVAVDASTWRFFVENGFWIQEAILCPTFLPVEPVAGRSASTGVILPLDDSERILAAWGPFGAEESAI